ncbi:catalase family protein [Massilia atriviolacea]|uniref:Catalase n=1 Tax=Massilia atriviolacea TaxID=2495579 RepID=A0A430HRL2_9BURK|nr:catalase [Massilia atriviolacea]
MHTTNGPSGAPLRYDPAFEIEEDGEAETTAGMLESLKHISATTYEHSGHATRSVHAKSHGLLLGELSVAQDLPPAYAQGLFAAPGRWPVVMRLSTTPGDVLDDKVSTPRGMALKVIGVPGARVEGSEGDSTQDFVLVNGPVFLAPSARRFLGSLKPLAATTDKAPKLKRAFSAVLQGAEKVIEAVGGESATIKSLGGHPETHPLGETYFSQAPILYGEYMAKVSLAPLSPELIALSGQSVDLSGTPDGLRAVVQAHFAGHGAEWALRVQLCTNLETMPIEDASVAWPEEESPWVTVAHLRALPQAAWSEALSKAVDDGMQFNPWHALAAHRPIGSIMRVRKAAYAMSKRFRAARNGVSVGEPRDAAVLTGIALDKP